MTPKEKTRLEAKAHEAAQNFAQAFGGTKQGTRFLVNELIIWFLDGQLSILEETRKEINARKK